MSCVARRQGHEGVGEVMSRQALPYLLQEPQGRGLPQARGRAGDEGRDVTERHGSVVRCL